MTVRIEKKGKVWTVIHSRPESRNAMDPESADALVAAFQQFDRVVLRQLAGTDQFVVLVDRKPEDGFAGERGARREKRGKNFFLCVGHNTRGRPASLLGSRPGGALRGLR